jgi:hypothetical protein
MSAGERDRLDGLVGELQQAAEQLRALPEETAADDAAALVERCAELAGQLAAELDRRARDARAEPLPGQETLL